jgi:hypothetical protein
MATNQLITDINKLASVAVSKIDSKKALIRGKIGNLEKVLKSVNAKILEQEDTISSLREQVLNTSLKETQSKDPEELSVLRTDKQKLQAALSGVRKEQQDYIAQNAELRTKLEELQAKFDEVTSEKISKLEQIQGTLKLITSGIENSADSIGDKIDEITDSMIDIARGVVVEGDLPVAAEPIIGDDEAELDDGDEPESEDDEPELEDDESESEDDEPELEDDEPELEDDEPELEDDEPELEDDEPELEDDEPELEDDEPELEDDDMKFGNSKLYIEDSDDEY